MFTRRNAKILVSVAFLLAPVVLFTVISKLTHQMHWGWGSPLIPGSDWIRWSHLCLIVGSAFCGFLYLPIILSIIRRKFRGLLALLFPMVLFLLTSVVFAGFSKHQFLIQENERIDQALDKEPANEALYVAKAVLLQRIEKYDEAIGYFKKALGKNPNDAFLIHDIGFTYLTQGDNYRRKGDHEKSREAYGLALPYFTKTLEMRSEPESFIAQTYNDRAVAYFFLGEFENSRRDAQKAADLGYHLHPGFAAALRRSELSTVDTPKAKS